MGKVFLSITMSLDGFTAGQVITQEHPMGLNGQLLHKWLFADKQKEDEEIASDMFNNCGAVILGSRTYNTAIDGVWESQSPFPVPALVLSSKRLNVIKGFKVVNDGIQTALSEAKSIAKEKDILVMGGANVAQQFLEADLLDELHIHIAPILLGSGTRLFENATNRIIELTKIKVIETPGATHLFFKPIRK
ncbi:dihydrofolate reductase family protein [Flavihumibacter fluvii]|uniref:dihydrofolate reductase family protein n=1 Tax=Flavihumibacter fluvii TaxID=2838157 RepID=UPI001BDEDB31|nr:dihydrofolate reductase family protein [Flavihumibacter fluvii]ULQ51727.1 dihydrofolate reductase family protein [Flavihumibacter fluvii]